MAGLTETKKDKKVEIYTKDTTGTSRRSGGFSPESGVIIGAAGKGSIGSLDENIKLHRGASGLQFVKETDTTPDGESAPYSNLAFVTMLTSDDLIVGSTAQVAAGKATHSTLSTAISEAISGNTIYILELDAPITEGATITLNKRLNIMGKGNGSEISDNFIMASTASKSLIKNVRFGQDLTIQASCNNSIVTECWADSSSVFIDSGTDNLIEILQEA